ncbi:Holliday junction resolvase [Clostridiales bacterium PH28_bin88]|nr:Holliday junction resolvase [Clostridiales bacterium PH28_bin88]
MRLMGLDIGDKTIGVALSDPLGWTAQGLTTLRRGEEVVEDITRLRGLISDYQVEEVVVGLPKNMDGSLGPQAQKVLEFVSLLRETLPQPIHLWDERLSTVAAERVLLDADLSRRRRKQVIDKMAAVMILQGFLDSRGR